MHVRVEEATLLIKTVISRHEAEPQNVTELYNYRLLSMYSTLIKALTCTLLQEQNSFPSMDGKGAPQSVNFVDVG
jgi:hypothetical protein